MLHSREVPIFVRPLWLVLSMGVPAGRAGTCEQLAELIQEGLQQQGPFLFHAALA